MCGQKRVNFFQISVGNEKIETKGIFFFHINQIVFCLKHSKMSHQFKIKTQKLAEFFAD
jgi:hypothetical protein